MFCQRRRRRETYKLDVQFLKGFRDNLVELREAMNDYVEICKEMHLRYQAKKTQAAQCNQIVKDCLAPKDDGDQHIQNGGDDQNLEEKETNVEVVVENNDICEVCVQNEVETKSLDDSEEKSEEKTKEQEENVKIKKIEKRKENVASTKREESVKRETMKKKEETKKEMSVSEKKCLSEKKHESEDCFPSVFDDSINTHWIIKFKLSYQQQWETNVLCKMFTFESREDIPIQVFEKERDDNYKAALQGNLSDSRTNPFEEGEDDKNHGGPSARILKTHLIS